MSLWDSCALTGSLRPKPEVKDNFPPYGHAHTISEVSSGAVSQFAGLLHQVALEHDREVNHLRAEIARLSKVVETGGLPLEVLRPARVNEDSDRLWIATPLTRPTNVDHIAHHGIGPSMVTTTLEPADMEQRLARERKNSLSGPQCLPPLKPEFTVDDSDIGFSIQASLTDAATIIRHSTALQKGLPPNAVLGVQATYSESIQLQASTIETKLASERSPMERWYSLITIAKDAGTIVRLNPIWSEVLEASVDLGSLLAGDDLCHNKSLRTYLIDVVLDPAKLRHAGSSSMDAMGVGTRIAKRNMLKSCFSILLRAMVLHPNSRARMLWDVGGLLLLIHDFILIPLQAFESGTDGLGPFYSRFEKQLERFAVAFWSLDILVSFVTGYYTEEGYMEISHRKIAINYLRTWFPMDLVIVIADWVSLLLILKSEVGVLRLGKTISRFMRILRLLRFMKLNQNLNYIVEHINSEYILTFVGVSKLLVGMVFANHYIACGWYALSQIRYETTWAKKFLVERHNMAMSYAYLSSLHWSLTQFTPASMEIHPTNQYERLYTIVVIIGAMVTFSSFVSSITGAMTHLRNVNAKKAEQDAAIRMYFSMNKISQELASQVWQFRRHNTMATQLRIKESDLPALKYLPERVRENLRLEVFTPHLEQHPLFQKYWTRCPEGMLQICNQAITERQVLAGEELKEIKHTVDRMFFVSYGLMEYHTPEFHLAMRWEDEKLDKTRDGGQMESAGSGCGYGSEDILEDFRVNKGEWACEIALWSSMARTQGPFVGGDSCCELVVLLRDSFHEIVRNQPDGGEMISRYAEGFVKAFNAASANPLVTNILFNGADGPCCVLEEIGLGLPQLPKTFYRKAFRQSSTGIRNSRNSRNSRGSPRSNSR